MTEAVTRDELDERCANCRRVEEAEHRRQEEVIGRVVYKAIAANMRGLVPASIVWFNKLESAALGALFVAFLGLVVYTSTH